MDKTWIKAALIRAVKTFAQTCVAMIPVGISITEVGWVQVLGTGALAFVCSILTSVAGLPEVDYENHFYKWTEIAEKREDSNEDNQSES